MDLGCISSPPVLQFRQESANRWSTVNAQYEQPSVGGDGFNCPVCGAYAHQIWSRVGIAHDPNPTFSDGRAPKRRQSIDPLSRNANFEDTARYHGITNVCVSECQKCGEMAIWIHDRVVWPFGGSAPSPNPELPGDVRSDYEEAAAVAMQSPRSAAALLRLAVEKLCRSLVPEGADLNSCIAKLVERGLNRQIQQALDYVRVVGNNAVHPGRMDVSDDPEAVSMLFTLVNLIADTMITLRDRVDALYKTLPESTRTVIAKRDGCT